MMQDVGDGVFDLHTTLNKLTLVGTAMVTRKILKMDDCMFSEGQSRFYINGGVRKSIFEGESDPI